MPERSFGRTVRYRRTKLGLSQAALGDLVGRSTGTIRSWERDITQPNDPKVLAALAAILGVDERQLFEKAGTDLPEVEARPTVEQELATLAPDKPEEQSESGSEIGDPPDRDEEPSRHPIEASHEVDPTYVTPPDPYLITPPTPTPADLSYVEDQSQRQLYRLRTLATLVISVALVIAFLWAFSESLGALSEWWDEFFGNLRL